MKKTTRKPNDRGPVHISKILPVVLDDIMRRVQAHHAQEVIEKQEPKKTFVALCPEVDTTVN